LRGGVVAVSKQQILRRLLGLLTLVSAALAAYFSYKVFAYIVGVEPGSLESYVSWMQALVYILFVLAAAYVLVATYRRRA